MIIKNLIHHIPHSIVLFLLAFFIVPKMVFAQVVINEIMYDLSGADDKHEWVEIYNSGSSPVDLTGWKFNDGANHLLNSPPEKGSRGSLVINPDQYILLADDATLLAADLPNYQGTIIDTVINLSNTGETLKLFDEDGVEAATILYNKDTGAAGNSRSLEWDGTALKESSVDGGTPGQTNSVLTSLDPITSATPTMTPLTSPNNATSALGRDSTSDNIGTGTPAPVGPTFDYSQDIFINEFMPAPPNDEQEWLELINTGERDVNLSGWQIDDEANSTKPQTIPENTVIMPNKYLVIAFGKSTLNNDGDRVRLLWPDDQVVHSVAYEKTKSGWAAAKFDAGWLWTNQPTPGAPNRKSFTANEESISLANAPAGANKMTTIEDAVTVNAETTPQPTSSGAASLKMTPNNQPVPAIADGAINNQMPTGAAAPNTNLTAAAANTPPKNSGLNAALGLIGVILLSAVTAGALIYFKRKTAAQD